MGRRPCCDKSKVKRGSWSPQEDATLKNYIHTHGIGGNWITLPQKAGLERCGKSCRLRWLNYLRPNIKHGDFTHHEDFIISNLFNTIGSRWSIISSHLPGRTDNDVKNYWNTKLKKKHMMATPHTSTHRNKSELISTDQRIAATVHSATATGAATASQIVPTNEQALQDFPTPYDVPSVLNEPIILSYPGYSFNHGGSSGNYMNFPFCPSHQDFSPIFHESNGVKMDGYSFEFVNDIWSHEEVAINGGNSDADLFSIFPCSF